jgi:hypothetical protein
LRCRSVIEEGFAFIVCFVRSVFGAPPKGNSTFQAFLARFTLLTETRKRKLHSDTNLFLLSIFQVKSQLLLPSPNEPKRAPGRGAGGEVKCRNFGQQERFCVETHLFGNIPFRKNRNFKCEEAHGRSVSSPHGWATTYKFNLHIPFAVSEVRAETNLQKARRKNEWE